HPTPPPPPPPPQEHTHTHTHTHTHQLSISQTHRLISYPNLTHTHTHTHQLSQSNTNICYPNNTNPSLCNSYCIFTATEERSERVMKEGKREGWRGVERGRTDCIFS